MNLKKTTMIQRNSILIYIISLLCLVSCDNKKSISEVTEDNEIIKIELSLEEANRLSLLPMECIQTPLPYKAGLVIADSSDLKMPQNHHPAFYGCFDWHSAVHGHWSLIYLLKSFPELKNSQEIRRMLNENLTAEKIQKEIKYFSLNKYSKSFERTYGWAWLLKLQEELYNWDDEDAKKWYANIQPLADYISKAYIEYLPKLVYAIRVGEHSNTAFGLSFAYDYAVATEDKNLQESIEANAKRFYLEDSDCPIDWEPSGYDFLSPCLQEMDIMRKLLTEVEFEDWLKRFLPDLTKEKFKLTPGKIIDRSDGKLVHLDGLNFSRAWCLYGVNNSTLAVKIADEHMTYSLDKIVDGDYAGQHWLASFALYAYKCKNENKQ